MIRYNHVILKTHQRVPETCVSQRLKSYFCYKKKPRQKIFICRGEKSISISSEMKPRSPLENKVEIWRFFAKIHNTDVSDRDFAA